MAVGSAGATPFGGHAGPVVSVAFSPDGATVAIFQRLITAPGDKHLADILATADPAPAAGAAIFTRSPAQRLLAELLTIISETGLPGTVAPYQRWCPQLARYSFHTRDIAGRPADDLLPSADRDRLPQVNSAYGDLAPRGAPVPVSQVSYPVRRRG